ncbi:MAG: hypothetical protein A2293_03025 [Elusimicrobia bacterium RIFOXYB2_FULL_49_7]|nr:MAG: hypothetical protein A2293_03025 [Elusimicrobia bacterium RIFOXYB2_FULL_49_7]
MGNPPNRLLAICPIGIGNFLLLEPALRHLKQTAPTLHLGLLCLKPEIARLAARYSFIDEILSIDAKAQNGFLQKLSYIKTLRGRFDASLAFFPTNRREYNLLPFLCAIPERFAFRYASQRFNSLSFLNTRFAEVRPDTHDLLQNFNLLRFLDIQPPPSPDLARIPLTPEEHGFAAQYLIEHGLSDRPLIGIHPGSSGDHGMDKKRWPASRFGELAKLILTKRKARFLVFGGPEEEALKERVVTACGAEAVAVKTKTFFESTALIEKCDAFISNDSGLMHVAVCTGVKTVGIFGPTDHVRTAPFGSQNRVIRGECPYQPCWTLSTAGKREACRFGDVRCLRYLSAEKVFNAVSAFAPI